MESENTSKQMSFCLPCHFFGLQPRGLPGKKIASPGPLAWSKGRWKKGKKKSYLPSPTYLFWGFFWGRFLGLILDLFFNGVFELVMEFFQKGFVVFLNSPCWETHKNAITKSQKLKKKKPERHLPTWFIGHLPDIRRFQFSFSWTPLAAALLGPGGWRGLW